MNTRRIPPPINPDLVVLAASLPEYPDEFVSVRPAQYVANTQAMFNRVGVILFSANPDPEDRRFLEVPLTCPTRFFDEIREKYPHKVPRWRVSPGRGRCVTDS